MDRIDPQRAYLKHYENYLFLSFVHQNSTDRIEVWQAGKELKICERKLEFWKRKPGWDATTVGRECEKLKAPWKGRITIGGTNV